LPFPVNGLSVLDVCCGSGMISEYYNKSGAKVTGIDLSQKAIERAKIRKEKYKFEAEFKIADATNLPFPDNSFDISAVHDGLHHLKEPWKAVREMFRVAKKAIIIIEPAKASITRISVALDISQDYEGKDFVYRFEENEIRQCLKKLGCNETVTKRYIMYYPHKPGRIFCVLGMPILFHLVKMAFYFLNILFGRFGNKIQTVALK
jgi:ubiquinone/menaquinone biosynthesis C-methylase UbiE